jgi:DNA polymerase (family 10)
MIKRPFTRRRLDRDFTVKNKELAIIFSRIADALEIKGESGFKIGAYRRLARTLDEMTKDIAELAAVNQLQDIPGVGSGTAKKIDEYLATGRMKKFDEAIAGVPEGLFELLNIQSLGAKTVHIAYKELGVKNLEDLKRVIDDGSLAGLYGLGEKKVQNIAKGIKIYEHAQARIPVYEATILVEEILDYLKNAPGIGRLSAAGSLRRMKETVGDIDILATGKDGARIIRYFTEFQGVDRTLVAGTTKGSVLLNLERKERQVDIRIVNESEYGAALQYFTGSKAHNIKLRSWANKKGLKISEYGVFKGTTKIAGASEEEVYSSLGLRFIPPEMREDRGEVELASEKDLPKIVDFSDIKGDLHVHTQYSDGVLSLEELAEFARVMKYEYVAVCDHSQSVKYANGLSPDRLKQQIEAVEKLNAKLKDVQILKGTEVDILFDGSLDFPDSLLGEMDFVVAAVHSGFKKNVTERMIEAMQNPFVSVIAHPSGRLISRREGYDVDLDRVLEEASKKGVALELNAYYDRLDLNEFNLMKAKDKGIKISLGTDTHQASGLDMMRFGVGIARRAWLTKSDILNCLSYKDLAGKA